MPANNITFPHSLSSLSLSSPSSPNASPEPLPENYFVYEGNVFASSINFRNSKELTACFKVLCDPTFNPSQKITLVIRRDLVFFMVKCGKEDDRNLAYFGLFSSLTKVLFGKEVTHEFSCDGLVELLSKEDAGLIMMVVSSDIKEIIIHYAHILPDFLANEPLMASLEEGKMDDVSHVCKNTVQKSCFEAKYIALLANQVENEAKSEPVSILFSEIERKIHIQLGSVALKMPPAPPSKEYHAKFVMPFWDHFTTIANMATECEMGMLDNDAYNYCNFGVDDVGIFTFYIDTTWLVHGN